MDRAAMLCGSKPNRARISAYLAEQRGLPFSYAEVGYTARLAPRGYNVDRTSIQLGSGREVFDRAKRAITQWKMFDMPWVELCWPDAPIAVGAAVAVLVSHLGFWSLNAARIIYVLDDHGRTERYGFAYGTLPGHNETGEEQFTVELDSSDQSVRYNLEAFSRPNGLARIGYPISRNLQKRFAKDSMRAMCKAVSAPAH